MTERNVSLAVPCAQVVEPRTLQSMMSLVGYSVAHGVKLHHIGITERTLIDDARNILVESFLKTSVEWLFFMDSDMTFPSDTLIKLFQVAEEKDAKLVTGVYYQRMGMHYPCLWTRGETTETGAITGQGDPRSKYNKYLASFAIIHSDKKEPFKVHSAGFGCVLIHRSILEKMDRPWFKFIHKMCSEDFYFFVNAKELGYDLWAVPDIELGHLGPSEEITKYSFAKKATEKNIEVEQIV